MNQTRTPTPGSNYSGRGSQQRSVAARSAQAYSESTARPSSTTTQGIMLPSPGPYQQGGAHPYESQQNPYAYQPTYGTAAGQQYPDPSSYGAMYNDQDAYPSQYATPIDSRATTPSSAYASGIIPTWNSGSEENGGNLPKQQPSQDVGGPYPRKSKKKKKKTAADPESKFTPLTQPLSVLTKGWDHVPVVDIDAYVNRSIEVRRREVAEGKIPGKIKRPMNSFMLYRKAYQNRTKKWCLQQNHQVVSQVCGDSWPLETKEVREQFNEWSRIERTNHHLAHPEYKFSPSKASAVKAATKRKAAEVNQTDESDLESYEWQEEGQKPRKNLRTTPRKKALIASYDYDSEASEMPSYHGHGLSPYPGNSPGQMLAPSYSPSLAGTPSYLQPIQQNLYDPGHGSSMYRQHNMTIMNPTEPPVGQLYPELDQYQIDDFQTPDHKIDPSLTAQGAEAYGSGYAGQQSIYHGADVESELPWEVSYSLGNQETFTDHPTPLSGQSNPDHLQLHEQNTQILKGEAESWTVEQLGGVSELDWQEFDEGN